jgi:transposase
MDRRHWDHARALAPRFLLRCEQLFAKLKTLLRKAAERTVEATWQRIGLLLDAFRPSECANYLKNAGYASI